MYGDRSSARLSSRLAGTVVATIVYGAATVVLPFVWAGVRPSIPDLLVGWTLIGSGVALAERKPSMSAWLIAAAGVAWFALDFSPLLSGAMRRGLEDTALVYLALLAHGVLALPTGRQAGWLERVAAAVVYGVAAVAATGYYLVGLVLAGALIVVATIRRWVISGDRGTRAATAALGAGVVLGSGVFTTNLLRLTTSPPSESVLERGLLLAIVVTSVLAFVAGSAQLDYPGGIDLGNGAVGALESAVGRRLGRAAVGVWFPTAGGGWIDPSGGTVRPDSARQHLIRDGDHVIAALAAETPLLGDIAPDLRELLRLAGAHARLQVEVRSRLDELTESRRRLLDAGDAERKQLELQLRRGALARLGTVERLIACDERLGPLRHRVLNTRIELDGIARGIDPLAAGCLDQALNDMARWCQLAVTVNVTAAEPPGHVARAVWYTCSEALANAAKHAPGSSVEVTVEATSSELVATVIDDGPGGTNPDGSGLSGLADRAAALGGSFIVTDHGSGTQIVLTVPLGDKG